MWKPTSSWSPADPAHAYEYYIIHVYSSYTYICNTCHVFPVSLEESQYLAAALARRRPGRSANDLRDGARQLLRLYAPWAETGKTVQYANFDMHHALPAWIIAMHLQLHSLVYLYVSSGCSGLRFMQKVHQHSSCRNDQATDSTDWISLSWVQFASTGIPKAVGAGPGHEWLPFNHSGFETHFDLL